MGLTRGIQFVVERRTLPSSSQWPVRVKVQVMDSFAVTLLMEDLLLDLQVPQTPRVVITADTNTHTRQIFCHRLHILALPADGDRGADETLPGRSQEASRRMPGDPGHPLIVTLDVCHWFIAASTQKWQLGDTETPQRLLFLLFLLTSPGSTASLNHRLRTTPGWHLIGRERSQLVDGRQWSRHWCSVLEHSGRSRDHSQQQQVQASHTLQ